MLIVCYAVQFFPSLNMKLELQVRHSLCVCPDKQLSRIQQLPGLARLAL